MALRFASRLRRVLGSCSSSSCSSSSCSSAMLSSSILLSPSLSQSTGILHFSSSSFSYTPTVITTEARGGESLQEDLTAAFTGIQNVGSRRGKSGGKLTRRGGRERQTSTSTSASAGATTPRWMPKFVIAVVSNYGGDVTEGSLAKAIEESNLTCPVVGCQAKRVREIRRGHRWQPSVTCWSLYFKDEDKVSDSFAFLQQHTSLPDLNKWSPLSLKDHVLDREKHPFTFALGGEGVKELTRRNQNIFEGSLHCGAIPRLHSKPTYFVGNAGDQNACIVSDAGSIAGLGFVGNGLKDYDYVKFMRKVLSEHWFKDISGCERWLFVPKSGTLKGSFKEEPFEQYFLAKEAYGIPMFPINGSCLYPATTMELSIFEPRYRAMVKQCVENKEVFGFIPRDDENNKFVDTIGTVARITEIDSMDSTGKCRIVIEGLRRFTFKKGSSLRIQPGSFGLGYADIQFYDDNPDEDDDDSLIYAASDGFGSELQMLQRRAKKFLGGGDQLASAHDMSFQLAQLSGAPQQLKIRWLKSISTADRLNETIEFFDSMPPSMPLN